MRRLHLCLHPQGGASKWVLHDSRTGAEMAEDDAPAALLGGLPAAAAAGAAGATPPQAADPAGSGGTSPAAAWSGQQVSPAASPQQAQQAQQQAQQGEPLQRVWVGFVGGPPPSSGSEAERQQQHSARSPGRPARLASAAPSPGATRSPGPVPRKLLVT